MTCLQFIHGLECEWFWYVQLELHIFHMQAWSECYNDTRMQSYNQPSENLRSCLKVIFARRFLSIPCSDCTAYSLQNKRWQKLEGLSKREKEKKRNKNSKDHKLHIIHRQSEFTRNHLVLIPTLYLSDLCRQFPTCHVQEATNQIYYVMAGVMDGKRRLNNCNLSLLTFGRVSKWTKDQLCFLFFLHNFLIFLQ